ncbi:hypothetical protein Tco_1518739 [Tanacetum coccineum]
MLHAGTLSSLQNLDKELSFAYQFLVEKSHEDEPEKTNTESEVHFSTSLHNGSSTTTNINSNCHSNHNNNISSTTTNSTTTRPLRFDLNSVHRLYKLENLDIPYQVSKAVDEIFMDVVDWAIQAPLRDRFRDLPEADMKEILHHRMWETNSYKSHEDHKKLYETLEKSIDRPSGTSRASGASRSSQLPPPPSPLSTNQSDQSKSTTAPSSSKTATSAEYTAWTTTDTRLKSSVSSIPEDLHMDADSAPDEQWKPLSEEDRPATPEPAWSIPSSDLPVPTNNWASALASTYAPPLEILLLAQTGDMETFMDCFPSLCDPPPVPNCHKLLTDQVDDAILRYNVSKPLPLGGPQGQVTIQSNFFFKKDLEYLKYGCKGSRPALSI